MFVFQIDLFMPRNFLCIIIHISISFQFYTNEIIWDTPIHKWFFSLKYYSLNTFHHSTINLSHALFSHFIFNGA